ncbi:MAG: hypothetical protein WCA13_07870 [Terriglobales bacterium]
MLSPPVDVTEAKMVFGVQPADAPKQVSRTNTSPKPLAPLLTIFVAPEAKATNSSPELIQGEPPLAAVPSRATEISVVVGTQPAGAPLHVSRKNAQLLSPPHTDVPGSMFVACESNATKRPSPVIEESRLLPFVGEPSEVAEIRVVLGVQPDGADPRQVSRR